MTTGVPSCKSTEDNTPMLSKEALPELEKIFADLARRIVNWAKNPDARWSGNKLDIPDFPEWSFLL